MPTGPGDDAGTEYPAVSGTGSLDDGVRCWAALGGTVRCHAPLYSAMRADPLLRNACLVAPRRAEYHLLYHVQH